MRPHHPHQGHPAEEQARRQQAEHRLRQDGGEGIGARGRVEPAQRVGVEGGIPPGLAGMRIMACGELLGPEVVEASIAVKRFFGRRSETVLGGENRRLEDDQADSQSKQDDERATKEAGSPFHAAKTLAEQIEVDRGQEGLIPGGDSVR